MHIAIIALLVVIVLILLGVFLPAMAVAAAWLIAISPHLAVVGAVFAAAIVVVLGWYAIKGDL